MSRNVQQIHTYCAMCVSRCGVVATVEDGLLRKVTADPEHPNGCICVKGTAAPEIVYSPDRLQYPMVRTRPKGDPDPGWVRVSWDEALDLVTSRLLDIKGHFGAEAVVFNRATPDGSATSDLNRWTERLANAFGSPNFMANTHICQWHRAQGAQYTFGVGLPRPDYANARCILLWGFNPQASWPADAARLSQARARGARLIVVDPRRTSLAERADLWLQVRPGGDGALALSMIHVLLEEGLYDASFVRDWTNGPFLVRDDTGRLLTEQDLDPARDPESFVVWDDRSGKPIGYRADRGYGALGPHPPTPSPNPGRGGADGPGSSPLLLDLALADGRTVTCRPAFELLRELAAGYAPERVEELTWVPAAEVRAAARLFATELPSCYFTWVGLEQHRDAMQTNRAVSIFYALTGQFDARGSNVLFAATPTNSVMGQELLPREQADRRLGYAERPLGPPGVPGFVPSYDVYRAILTGQPYPVKALVSFGGDLLLGKGEPRRGKAALEALDFYVHMDLVGNPSASLADVLLPAASCWEREALMPSFDTAEETTTWTQLRSAVVPPVHESRADLDVIFELATRLGLGEQFFDGDLDAGFDYQLAPAGLTAQQLREHPMGMRYPGQTRYRKYAEVDTVSGQPRGFATPTRKLEIYSTHFARAGYAPLPVLEKPVEAPGLDAGGEYPLTLTFFRMVQFCNEQHRHIPRLRRQVPEPGVELHPATAAAAGIQDGDWVVVETAAGGARLKAKLNAGLHRRVVATAYGWWQGCQELGLPAYDPLAPTGANANLLMSDQGIDPISGSVPYRSQRCRVRRADDGS